jgi:uncharacterized protein
MILSNDFTVEAPVASTWRTMMDVERVAGCLPGSQIEPVGEDGTYRGALKLKVGPVTMAYQGTVRLQDIDDGAHTLSYDASAREQRGTGTAAAVIRARLEPESGGSGTHVTVETELNVTGRAAQFGRGIMQDVAGAMLGTFASGLQQLIADGDPGVEPGDAVGDALSHDRSAPAGGGRQNDDVLDLGASLWSAVPRRAAAVTAAVLAGGTLALFGRRRRRGVELQITLRLR